MIWFFFILHCFFIPTLFSKPILIGIAGGTGSGKTTLAQKIAEHFETSSVIIAQDAYYKDNSHLSYEEASKINFDHPNALDFSALHTHLIDLKEGKAIYQPIYNFQTHCRETKTRCIDPSPLIIVEGILLFAVEEIRNLFDLKIFVDTDSDVRLLRRIERDIEQRARTLSSVQKQYLGTVKPMHEAFVEPSKQHADIIVPQGGANPIALDMIIAMLYKTHSGLTCCHCQKEQIKAAANRLE